MRDLVTGFLTAAGEADYRYSPWARVVPFTTVLH
jgi:hypothetical protein